MTGEAYTSISKRFSYTLIAITAFVLLIFAIVAVVVNFSRTEDQLEKSLSNAQMLAESALRIPLWNLDYVAAQGIVDSLLLDEQIVFAAVVVEGEDVATKAREPFDDATFDDVKSMSHVITGDIDIRHQDESLGTLQLAMSRAEIRETILINVIGIALLTVLILGAIALTSILISRRYIAMPLSKLQHSASAIAAGDLEAPVDIEGKDEVGSLARNLDVMRQSIKELISALQEANRQQFRQVLDVCPAGLLVVSEEGRLVFYNQSFRNMLGYDDQELQDIDTGRFWTDRDQHERINNLARERDDQLIDQEVSWQTKDGDPLAGLLSYTQIDDQGGQSSFSGGSRIAWFYDISELKRREEQLARTSDRLQLALSMEGVGIWDADLVNDEVWWSREYTDLMRHDPETYQPSATAWEEHLHPDEAEATIAKVDGFLEGGDTVLRLPEHFLRGDGSDIWVDSLMRVQRDVDGQAVRLSGLDVDITEQLKRERQLADANRFIMESLRYASRIQSAVLPAEEMIGQSTGEHFLIWEPRDIVGGDFFWHHSMPDGYCVIVGDCTGHGVPGAFMTLIACGFLDRALESGLDRPSLVLSDLHRNLQTLLGQDQADGGTDDGLEAGICFVSETERKLVFSGARFSLFHEHDSEISEVRGDKAGIGYRRFAADTVFSDVVIDLSDSDRLYMTTDGLIDQIGGERRRAFGKKRFLGCLADTKDHSLPQQAEALKKIFDTYQGAEARRDDVTVLGFTPGLT